MQISGKDVNVYNFAMAHLRTLPGIDSATPQQINPGGTSYVLVAFHGDISQLAAALSARGLDGLDRGHRHHDALVVGEAAGAPPPPPQPAAPPQQPQPAASQPPGQQ